MAGDYGYDSVDQLRSFAHDKHKHNNNKYERGIVLMVLTELSSRIGVWEITWTAVSQTIIVSTGYSDFPVPPLGILNCTNQLTV